jgi:hypothetical protein
MLAGEVGELPREEAEVKQKVPDKEPRALDGCFSSSLISSVLSHANQSCVCRFPLTNTASLLRNLNMASANEKASLAIRQTFFTSCMD